VVDTLGFDADRRVSQRGLASGLGCLRWPCCSAPIRPSAGAGTGCAHGQSRPPCSTVSLRRMPEMAGRLAAEGWTVVEAADDLTVEPSHSAGSQVAVASQRSQPAQLSLMLQISKFPWAKIRPAGCRSSRGGA